MRQLPLELLNKQTHHLAFNTLHFCCNWRTTFVRSQKGYLRQPNFSKGLTKLAIFPDYKRPGLICLALPPRQKFGLILVIKWLKNWFYQKMPITKNVLLNLYSSMKKKLRKIRMIFDIENWLWKSIFCTLRQAGKARQSIPGRL